MQNKSHPFIRLKLIVFDEWNFEAKDPLLPARLRHIHQPINRRVVNGGFESAPGKDRRKIEERGKSSRFLRPGDSRKVFSVLKFRAHRRLPEAARFPHKRNEFGE